MIRAWRRFAKLRTLYCDTESAVASDEMGVWLERRGAKRELVPKESHLGLAERHGELWVDGARRLKAAAAAEGMELSTKDALSEAMEAKNASLLFGSGFAPIQGLTGEMLDWDLEQVGREDVENAEGPFARSFRLRCLAICSITEAVYQQRLKRGSSSRAPVPDPEIYSKGMRVEIWGAPTHKDLSGWKGPADVIEVTKSGNVAVRWQGTYKECAPHLVRPFDFQAGFFVSCDDKSYDFLVKEILHELMALAEALTPGKHKAWGGLPQPGWLRVPPRRDPDRR